jgi:hypothetical protein
METKEMLARIDAELSRLQQVRSILIGGAKDGRKIKTASKSAPQKRRSSAEARAKIAAAQRARWARAKKTAK